ncbi:MAG: zinc-binding dehydrogenase [Pseudomonadota bacterium]
MKAITVQDGQIELVERQMPTPGAGQVLVKSRACGICGSDLHILHHPEEMARLAGAMAGATEEGAPAPAANAGGAGGAPEIRLGHEYCAEVVAHGPGAEGAPPVGARVCSIPFLIAPDAGPMGMVGVGLSEGVYGGMSEYFLLQSEFLLPVPDGLDDAGAAMAEPLAVALHFVTRSEMAPSQVALVVGCGPIGLFTIEALKLRGVSRIIASDPHPGRRAIAEALGAASVLDPGVDNVMARAAEAAGETGEALAVFECSGATAVIPPLVAEAPANTRIVVGGVHTTPLTIDPGLAMLKEIDLRFAFVYSPEEYAEALQALGDGRVAWRRLVTGKVGVDGVADAFRVLSAPSDHVKIIVEPWREGGLEAFA